MVLPILRTVLSTHLTFPPNASVTVDLCLLIEHISSFTSCDGMVYSPLLLHFPVILQLLLLPWTYYSTQFWSFICKANVWCLALI